MSQHGLWTVSWAGPEGVWEALEPEAEELASVSAQLAEWYNESHNRTMMSNTDDFSASEVIEHYQDVSSQGGLNFLLRLGGRLMGDADFRHINRAARSAEFAIMIGERPEQGRGYGTGFATLLHILGFERLGFERLFVSIIPANAGSLRLFEKLGYRPDESPAAGAYRDEEGDVVMSLARGDFHPARDIATGIVMTQRRSK